MIKVNVEFYYNVEDIIGDINDLNLTVGKREFNKVLKEVFIELIENEIDGVFQTGEVPDIIEEKLLKRGVIK